VHFSPLLGGEFDGESLAIPTNEEVKIWRNGFQCNGREGTWHMFVNGALKENSEDYVPAPYENIPPGDEIKLVFTEKSVSEINPKLGEQP